MSVTGLAAPPVPSPGRAATHPLLTITVHGLPAPQGSKRHLGNGVLVESSQRVKPWREAVKWAAIEAAETCPDGIRDKAHECLQTELDTFDGPVDVDVTFTLPRPKGHWRTGRNAHLLRDTAPSRPAGKPDVDKLLRSTMDALGDAGVWADDSQVVDLAGHKVYVDTGVDALPTPGAVIRIYTAGGA